MIFTIDGEDTKDIDDAVSLGNCPRRNTRLGVHIADVSHYVQRRVRARLEAYHARHLRVSCRTASSRCFRRELSNGICSLNPKVDRLALSCLMTIDGQGDVVEPSRIVEGVINSRAQMTYTKINKILAGDPAMIAQYPEIAAVSPAMQKLSKILYDKRAKAGLDQLRDDRT
ncbi:MAG: RNB domain-containing ribonuclease [Bacillus subtilis]|nr:RNB domain-containing ribonuclease [Bacillus subtilis]